MGGCFGDVVGRWTAHDDIRHPTTSDDVEACDDGLGVGVGVRVGSRTHRIARGVGHRRPRPTTTTKDGRATEDKTSGYFAVADRGGGRAGRRTAERRWGRTRARGRRGVWV